MRGALRVAGLTAVLGSVFVAIVGVSAPRIADAASGPNSGFVRAQGGQFVLDGAPFRFVGTNAYFLLDAANYGSTTHTENMLALANQLGFTVLRTWAFMDGTGSTGGFQTSLGVYDENTARQLDWILWKADLAGVRIILTLTNYWSDYGGMPWYVAQCVRAGASVNLFYTDVCSQTYFKQWVRFLVTRVNTFTNRPYWDDPTIFAWELANEPRSDDPTGEKVRAWVSDIAAYIKSLEAQQAQAVYGTAVANHMVDTGEEGFDTSSEGYSNVTDVYNGQAYLFNGGPGVSFSKNTSDPNIDFGSAHLYPEYWNFSFAAGNSWIADHIKIARSLGKPFVLGEFGVSSGAVPAEGDREAILRGWLDTSETWKAGGALVWELICSAVCSNYGGGFATYYPPSSSMTDMFAAAAALANGGAVPPPPPGPPLVSSLVPNGVVAGRSADFTVAVTGSNFDARTMVSFNGAARPTAFVSGTQLAVTLSAADVASEGTASITVQNEAGSSSPAPFTIRPAVTGCTPGSYLAQYYANTTLAEPLVFNRCEGRIDHDWGSGSPEPDSVPADRFSIRWTGQFAFNKGVYTFTARSDDGIRVKLDGATLISDWTDHAVKSYSKRVRVSAGAHTVQVEYYENGGLATIAVGW